MQQVIAVCNTAAKGKYYQPYIAMALANGYTVQVASCEAVILPSGEQADNIHNVPAEVITRQQSSWGNHQYQSTTREANNG